jgi:farnesyl diphosphate synthase
MVAERTGMGFQDELGRVAAAVERHLAAALDDAATAGEVIRPARLMAAMRHAVLGGGKRLRPMLVVAGAKAVGGDEAAAIRVGTAIELLHCYSLVHDDLPVMDDDDMRRGRPTVHKAFDEATAILAGDALLTLAFAVLADPATHPNAEVRAELVLGLARAGGAGGMVGGQMLDLAAEGRFAGGRPAPLPEPEIRRLQAMKTGALMAFSVEAGGIVGGADQRGRETLRRFGEMVGLAFQIADDLLDVTAEAAVVGKATGKDAAQGKATLIGLHGATAMRGELTRLVAAAEARLAPFGAHADLLQQAARFIAQRDR